MSQEFIPSLLSNNRGQAADSIENSPESLLGTRNSYINGTQNKFDQNKYKITNLMYPNDLMSEQYAGSYVIFNINVNNDSKLLRSPSVNVLDEADIGFRGQLLENKDRTEFSVGAASAGIGAVIGGGGTGILTSGKAALPGAALGGAVGAVSVGAVGTQTSNFTRSQKRLEAAIALHVPNIMNIRYGADWDSDDTAMFSMVEEGGEAIVKAFESLSDGGNSSNAFQDIRSKGGNIAAALGLKSAPQVVQGLSGLTTNPRKEQFFKGIDFRTFMFDYQFFPRSAEEAENVMNIIHMFKFHMHPEFKDDGTFLYVYPSEFDISYYFNHQENLNVHRHTSCVLTEINIQYTPNGAFTTFDNGIPTQINVQLSFKELGIITKELIERGY